MAGSLILDNSLVTAAFNTVIREPAAGGAGTVKGTFVATDNVVVKGLAVLASPLTFTAGYVFDGFAQISRGDDWRQPPPFGERIDQVAVKVSGRPKSAWSP